MINIILKSIKINNFKGIKSAELDFNSNENIIGGENGAGKTTIRNAWEFVLCENIANFVPNIKGQDITDTVCVSCVVEINGKCYEFKREKPYGKDYNYFIDGIPTKFRQYKEFIANLFSGNADYNVVNLLSDKNYFNNELTQAERANILYEMADAESVTSALKTKKEYSTIFDFLDKGYSIVEMQKLLKTRRSETKNQQDVINGMIAYLNDEISFIERNYDFDLIQSKLTDLNAELDVLITKTQGDITSDTVEKIQKQIEKLSKQKSDLSMERINKLNRLYEINEKLHSDGLRIQSEYNKYSARCTMLKTKIENFNPEINPICSECGTTLSSDKIDELRQNAQTTLQNIVDELESANNEKEKLEKENDLINSRRETVLLQINNFQKNSNKENEIETAIISLKTALESEKTSLLNKSLTEQINAVREQISELTQQMNFKNELNRHKEKISKCKANNVELADQLLKIIKKEIVLKDYVQEYTTLIADKLNSKFQNGIKWQLFTEKESDGEIIKEPVCNCTMNGVLYSSLSNGEKNVANIEVIKSLQEFYGAKLPVWSEDDESITINYDYEGQIFRLRATKDTKIENITMFKKEN